MAILGTAAGIILILMVLLDGFEAILLPRRIVRKLRFTRMYYRATWGTYLAATRFCEYPKTRSMLLSAFGPLSILVLLVLWAVGLIMGFGLITWSLSVPLNPTGQPADMMTYFYMSGVTFFTLGFGDFTASSPLGRFLSVTEAGLGFGFLAVIISYLPVIYQSFSKREITINLLDARAGSPPTAGELFARMGPRELRQLDSYFVEWERWCAELLEGTLSLPVLIFYRSQHDNQSWLASLTMILDVCALAMTEVELESTYQARLTFSMARHALVDIAQMFTAAPRNFETDRLSSERLHQLRTRLRAEGFSVRDGDAPGEMLEEIRGLYEPFLLALAQFCELHIPPILNDGPVVDNWQTSAWMRRAKGLGQMRTGLVHDDHDD